MKNIKTIVLFLSFILSVSLSSCEISLELLGAALEGDFKKNPARGVGSVTDEKSEESMDSIQNEIPMESAVFRMETWARVLKETWIYS